MHKTVGHQSAFAGYIERNVVSHEDCYLRVQAGSGDTNAGDRFGTDSGSSSKPSPLIRRISFASLV